jgi:hypothetical protein
MLSSEMIDEEISKMEKCIFSWTIIKTEIKENNPCSDTIRLYIKWESNAFHIDVHKAKEMCTFDGFSVLYGKNKNIPKKWDEVDFLIGKWLNPEPMVLSNMKVWEWAYKLISWTELKWDFEICNPNYKFIIWNIWIETKNIKYLEMWGVILWIIVFVFAIIALLKKYFKTS